MKKIHYELWYKKSGEENWTLEHANIQGKDCIDMNIERKFARDFRHSEVKLVRVETATESFDEPV